MGAPQPDNLSAERKISAVTRNWRRPAQLRDWILPNLESCAEIDELIVSHGRRDTVFEYESARCAVKHRADYDAINAQYGLARSYVAAAEARNELVLINDDDALITPAAIARLSAACRQDGAVIHSLLGREPTADLQYDDRDRFGDVTVALGGCSLITRQLARAVAAELDALRPRLVALYEDEAFMNGEDIFASLTAIKRSGRLNKAHPLPLALLQDPFDVGVSSGGRAASHRNVRTRLLKMLIPLWRLERHFAAKPAAPPPPVATADGLGAPHPRRIPLDHRLKRERAPSSKQPAARDAAPQKASIVLMNDAPAEIAAQIILPHLARMSARFDEIIILNAAENAVCEFKSAAIAIKRVNLFERDYDLAVLRAVGAARNKIVLLQDSHMLMKPAIVNELIDAQSADPAILRGVVGRRLLADYSLLPQTYKFKRGFDGFLPLVSPIGCALSRSLARAALSEAERLSRDADLKRLINRHWDIFIALFAVKQSRRYNFARGPDRDTGVIIFDRSIADADVAERAATQARLTKQLTALWNIKGVIIAPPQARNRRLIYAAKLAWLRLAPPLLERPLLKILERARTRRR